MRGRGSGAAPQLLVPGALRRGGELVGGRRRRGGVPWEPRMWSFDFGSGRELFSTSHHLTPNDGLPGEQPPTTLFQVWIWGCLKVPLPLAQEYVCIFPCWFSRKSITLGIGFIYFQGASANGGKEPLKLFFSLVSL